MTITTLHQPKQSSTPLGQALQEVLANTYGAFLATHNYHWNVEGANFVSLHGLFDAQVKELFEAIDIVAERIRALGEYALPFEGENIIQALKIIPNALNKENDAASKSNRMLHNLVALNAAVIASCQTAKTLSHQLNDDASETIMVDRITAHQKAVWMLNSCLSQ